VDRNTKQEQVSQLREQLQGMNHIFLCSFQGLTVDKDTRLRREIRATGGTYQVVKNTLLKLAFAGSSFEKLGDHLSGNTAIAYSRTDLVGLAKLINRYAKDQGKFAFKAGVVEGQVVEVSDLETLANLPSREELLSKLAYLLNWPIQGLAVSLNGVVRNLAVVLDQVKQQKENQ